MKARAQSIFRTAQVYERAARSLNTIAISDPSMLLPSMVNAALSLELYFKSLYILDKSVDFKVNNRHSHDFHALFDELHDSTKLQMTEKFDRLLASRDMSDVHHVDSTLKITVPTDFKMNLAEWANIFTDLRYVYDFVGKNKGTQRTMMFFPEIRDSAFDTIIDREPTWKP